MAIKKPNPKKTESSKAAQERMSWTSPDQVTITPPLKKKSNKK